jgi:hypothetical protein
MVKVSLSFFLWFGFHLLLFSQEEVQYKWILPLQTNMVPFGKASAEFTAAIQNKKAVLINVIGEKKELPYDSITNEFGSFWKIYKDGYQGIFHVHKGEIIPPVFDRVSVSLKNENNWCFEVVKYRMSALVNDHNRMIVPYRKDSFSGLIFIGDTILGVQKRYVNNPIVTDYDYFSYNGMPVSLADVRKQMVPDFQRISANQFVLTTYRNNKVKSDTFSGADKFVDDIAIVKRDSLWGYISRNGDWLITPKYQAAAPFDKDGYAVVKASGKIWNY